LFVNVCEQAIDAYQVEDYKLSVGAANESFVWLAAAASGSLAQTSHGAGYPASIAHSSG
jgi:hypothetical protein